MRHNPRMSRRAPSVITTPAVRRAGSCAALCVLVLTGCNRPSPVPEPVPTLQRLGEGDGSIEWRGALACADCDGIDAQLVLRRAGEQRDYTLSETYVVDDQGARFAEHGRWRRDGGMLQLRGDNGAVRHFALLGDGRLQPRDRHGAPLAVDDGDALVPVTALKGP
jgi:copper homeostasis protein (lipoprotein)